MEIRELIRENILETIADVLQPLDYVYAMWQCGSAAFKRVDQWSDIDLIVDVEDDKVRDIFAIVDKAIQTLAPIENSIESPQSLSPGAYQKVYKLEGTSKFMVIEICAVKHSSSEKFLQREIHGEIFVHFDKKDVTNVKPMDKEQFHKTLKVRLENIEKLFNMYQILVEKELNRKNDIEALAFYQNFTLSPLVEVLRMKHSPYRYNFRTRYVYYDLPKEIVKKLEALYFITDSNDLRLKQKEVIRWFNEIVTELKIKSV
jgi:predicted nucleotidyltransferase